MKKIFQYTMGILAAGLAMTACQPDTYDGADQKNIPTVADKDFAMVVDQETNQVQVSFPETPGVYPIWSFNGANYSTLNNAGYQNNKKGTYSVSLRLGNRNGFSQGALTKEFTFNETKANFTTELNRLNGKEWRFDYSEPAHLACGPYGGDGSGWWSAAPNEKKGTGMYDDRISFVSDGVTGGTFTYDPGEDGLTYINIGCSLWDNGGATADWDMANTVQNSTFELKKGDWTDADGNVIETNFLELAPKTFFPYISADKQYNEPCFRIETLTASKMVLVYENSDGDGISWRFIFTSKEPTAEIDPNDPANVKWVDVNSDANLGKDFNTKGEMNFWWADAGWGQIGNPQFSFANGVYTITANDATVSEWQAQNSIQNVAMNIEAGQAYDISAKIVASQALGRFTFKICEQSDDDNTLIYQGNLSLDAGENLVQFANVKAQKNGADTGFKEAKLFIDLGGCPAGLEVKLSDIIIQKHEGSTGGGFTWADVNSADNIGNSFNSIGTMQFWWADGGWGQIGDPGFAYDNGTYTITVTENGGSEWQAQCSIHNAALPIEAGQLYAVRATIESTAAVSRYTFKLCDEGDDDNTLVYNGGLSLEAGENVVEFKGVKAQKNGADTGFSEAKLFIDLGGATPGTIVSLSNIIVQKYNENAGGGGAGADLSYNSASNLWKAVDSGDAFISVTPWFADGGWAQIGDPEWSHDGSSWALTLPEGMGGSQWQGQFPINTTISAKQSDKYSFSCTINSDQDLSGVTIKLTETDDADGTKHDSNFFFAERHDVKANEPYVYTVSGATLPLNDAHALSLFFDFGGSPVGAFVEISDITLVKE